MTQEEKARAYDEALAKAKEQYNYPCMRSCMGILEEIFPELKESEDEKIRKELIDYINRLTASPNYIDKYNAWITWLEKQGNRGIDYYQNHQDSNHPNGCIVLEDFNGGDGFYKVNLDYLNKKQIEEIEKMVKVWNKESNSPNENIKDCIGMCLTDADEQRFKDYDTNLKDCLAWLEKQGDKDKFIEKELGCIKGYRENAIKRLEELEKQGDQKASYTTIVETGNGGINALVKLPIEMKTAEESLGIDSDTYNKIIDECIFGEQKPADKVEPRFKVGDKIYLKPEYRMPDDDTPIANTVFEIKAIDDKHYRFDGSYIFIEDQDKYALVEQKPATIDIDKMVDDYANNKERGNEEFGKPVPCMIRAYRQGLNDAIKKVVLKPAAWSEEDETVLYNLIYALANDRIGNNRDEYVDWLKSLRPQNTWKPSETDIMILEKVFSGKIDPKDFQKTLSNVLEQLKKLKEG